MALSQPNLMVSDLVAHRIVNMPLAARKRFTGKVRVANYPFKIEALMSAAVKSVFARVKYEHWVPSSVKNDDVYSVFYEAIKAVAALLETGSPLNWPGVATTISTAISYLREMKKNEASKYMKALFGQQTIPYSDDWWAEVETSLRTELTLRLRGSIAQYNDKLANFIRTAAQKGFSYEQTVAGIKDISKDISDTRAAFLARDLTGTINSMASQKMHVSVFGINTYIWVTAADERVRGTPGGPYASAIPSHYVMERVLCRWDNPLVYSLDGGATWVPRRPDMPMAHAGYAWSCRCVPEAFLPGVVTATKARLEQKR